MILDRYILGPALLMALVLLDLVAASVPPASQAQAQPQPSAQAPSSPPQAPGQPAKPPPTPLAVPAQHAQQNGVTTCLAPLNALAMAWSGQSPYVAASTWHNREANRRPFHAAMALDQPASLVLLAVAPASGGVCDAASQQISYTPQSCAALRETALRDWQAGLRASSAVGFVGPNGQTVYLIQGGTGCVIVEQRIAYGEAPRPAAAPAAPAGKAPAAPTPPSAPAGKR